MSSLRIWYLYGYLFLIWTAYHLVFFFPPWVDELLAKPVLELAPVLFIALVVEKKNFRMLGFSSKRPVDHLVVGSMIALGFILFRIAGRIVVNGGVVFNPFHLAPYDFILPAITSLAVGLQEETLFRGYFFQAFFSSTRNERTANIVSSLMFAANHMSLALFVHRYQPSDLFFYFMQAVLLGIVFAFMFARTKSILPSIVAHFVWNLSNTFVR